MAVKIAYAWKDYINSRLVEIFIYARKKLNNKKNTTISDY